MLVFAFLSDIMINQAKCRFFRGGCLVSLLNLVYKVSTNGPADGQLPLRNHRAAASVNRDHLPFQQPEAGNY